MAIRDVVKDGDPKLRMSSRTITEFNQRLFILLDDMLETMRKNDGTGIAAPQVGVLRRVVICQLEDESIVEMINPTILSKSKTMLRREEGCLSVPEKHCLVDRPESIKITFQDRNAKQITKTYEGFNARVCCHETDHLDGVLFYDREVKE